MDRSSSQPDTASPRSFSETELEAVSNYLVGMSTRPYPSVLVPQSAGPARVLVRASPARPCVHQREGFLHDRKVIVGQLLEQWKLDRVVAFFWLVEARLYFTALLFFTMSHVRHLVFTDL